MKRAVFLLLLVCCMFAFSIACGGSGSDSGTTPTPTESALTSAPATTTGTPAPLFIYWTEPSRKVITPAGQETYLNFRGESTQDASAVISVGTDSDNNYDNDGITWFNRTFPGGYYLVTICASDYAAGVYHIVAKITRGAETIVKYLQFEIEFTATPEVELTTPANDLIAAWDTSFTFSGNNIPADSTVRIGLDSDRNPTNGISGYIPGVPDAGNFNHNWLVGQQYSGRYFPFINVHKGDYDEYFYAPGSLLIGDLPSVTFTSPISQQRVHPQPVASVHIEGESFTNAAQATFQIGYDTDRNPGNGGITWIYSGLDIGTFSFDWDIDISAGGTYFIIGQVTDEYGTGSYYASGDIIVDNSTYIEFYHPLSDITITAGDIGYKNEVGQIVPLIATGWGYSQQGNNVIQLFYDNNANINDGFTPIGIPFPEGAINQMVDFSVMPPGEYFIGASITQGYGSPLVVWAPMKITILTNTDISHPGNSGPYYNSYEYFNVRDNDRNKDVRWRLYYPTDSFDTDHISETGPFPVVVFIPDRYGSSVNYTKYMYIVERMARWGYAVAVVRNRYNSAYGSSSRARLDAADASFILDWLASETADITSDYYGAIDMEKICVGGHAQGGGAAIIAAENDDRIDSAFAMDPRRVYTIATEGHPSRPYVAGVPMMIFRASLSTVRYYRPTNVRSVYYDQDPYKIMVTIEGANHIQFKDSVTAWESDGNPTMSIEEQHRRVQIMTIAFINSFLSGEGPTNYYRQWVDGAKVGSGDLSLISLMLSNPFGE